MTEEYFELKYDFELIVNIVKEKNYNNNVHFFSNRIFKKGIIDISASKFNIFDTIESINEYIRSTVELDYSDYIENIKKRYSTNYEIYTIFNIYNIQLI